MNNPKSSVTATWKEITWKLRAFSTVIFNITYLTGNKPLFHKIPADVTPRALICAAFSPLPSEACVRSSEGWESGVWKGPEMGTWGGQGCGYQVDTRREVGSRGSVARTEGVFVLGGGVVLRGVGVTHGCELDHDEGRAPKN